MAVRAVCVDGFSSGLVADGLQVAQILDPGHGENIHSNLILRCPAGASKDEVGHQRCKAI